MQIRVIQLLSSITNLTQVSRLRCVAFSNELILLFSRLCRHLALKVKIGYDHPESWNHVRAAFQKFGYEILDRHKEKLFAACWRSETHWLSCPRGEIYLLFNLPPCCKLERWWFPPSGAGKSSTGIT